MRQICVVLALLGATATASAHDGGRFGESGTVVPTGRIAFTLSNAQPPAGDATTSLDLDVGPGALFFVTRNLAVGGRLTGGWTRTGEGDAAATTINWGLTPQLGFNVSLSRGASFFPIVGFGYVQSHSKTGAASSVVRNRAAFYLDLPLLAHMGNFFIGFGPSFALDLWARVNAGPAASGADTKVLHIGAQTYLGGWF